MLREFPDGYVCVCNATYCDTFDGDRSYSGLLIISSSKVCVQKKNHIVWVDKIIYDELI